MDATPSDAARKCASPDGDGNLSRHVRACRFLSAVRGETAAAFGTAFWVLLGSGVVAGVGYLIHASGHSGATLSLTSDFVALHVADAFRVPAYLVAIFCGGEIAHRNAGTTNILVVPKVAALCAVVFVALTGFLVAVVVLQIASGEREIDVVLCAYAIYVNFGWHVALLAIVSMALQVVLGALRRSTTDVRRASQIKRSGMLIVAAVILLAWAVDGGDTPFGPGPVRYSGMNGYGHHLPLFHVSGLYWTALATLLVIAVHAWTCRYGAGLGPWWFQASTVNVGVPVLVVWVGAGCWIWANTAEPQANESLSRQEQQQRHARPGVVHVVAWDIAVDIHPTERRFESGGSALLANVGPGPIDELTIHFPRGAQGVGIDIPSTALVERNPESGLHRYAFARPLRPGERVRMHFQLAGEERGLRWRGRARLIENGSFHGSESVSVSHCL